jgi:hypothetical protein
LVSLWTGRLPDDKLDWWLKRIFPVLVVLVILHSIAGAWLLHATIGQSLPARLAITVILLAPLGFMMGMPFPLGMHWAGGHRPGVIPWLWGINGVMSVMGSAMSIALAIHIGLSTTLLIAAVLYGLAGAALVRELVSGQKLHGESGVLT